MRTRLLKEALPQSSLVSSTNAIDTASYQRVVASGVYSKKFWVG
jgi:hypothetical protein